MNLLTSFLQGTRSLVRATAALALVALAGAGPASAQDGPQPTLPAVRLSAGMHVITAELAATERQRTIGLMWREKLAPNHGMLFVFAAPAPQCFWMRNTLIPLSIAFIADDGTIVNIEDMKPRSDATHCSREPVRYALEMEQGWFARRAIRPGAKLGGIPPR